MAAESPLPEGTSIPDAGSSPVEVVIEPRSRDLDGLTVERVLPSAPRQMVGPFIFLDHIGPTLLRPPLALDVRPHPHIGLATVTYLLEGEVLHRDSLGSVQVIRPGAVNWMTAGRGVVHSERTPRELRGSATRLHGLQLWVALPRDLEEVAPSFHHHPADTLPEVAERGARIRLVVGAAFGARTRVETASPLFLADVRLSDGALLPLPADAVERGVYVVEGRLEVGGARLEPGRLAVIRPGAAPRLVAAGPTRAVLLGGEPLGERRHAWWNFVSSSRERIEEAKSAWAEEPDEDDMTRFDGRTVLVAGGTGALGRSVALALLAEGATVVVAGRRPEEAAPLADAAGPARARLRFVQADVAEAAGAERVVAAALERGRLRAVVNAVGGWSGAPILSDEAGQLQRMLSLNLLPGYHLLRAALPALSAGGDGAFVEIVSLAALGAQPGQAAYAASKAAALSLVLSVAEESRAKGVRVNAVLPGTMDTAANRNAMPGSDRKGWVSTEEVARVVLFLCSDEARAVSGAAVPVRGR